MANAKPTTKTQAPRYDEGGQRVTTCCGCYSTYSDADLVCRNCYNVVPEGEGDGMEFAPGVDEETYYEWAFRGQS